MPASNYGPGGKRKRKIMRKLRIREISGVGVPAQEGARALIMKAGEPPADDKVSKDDVAQAITGETDGHVHGISIMHYDDCRMSLYVSYATSDGADGSHSHQLYRGPDGSYSVLENAGHTHTLDSEALAMAIVSCMSKTHDNPGDAPMTNDEKKALKDATEGLEAMKAKAERLEKVLAMSPAHRAHFDTLADADADAWLEKSATDRDAALDALEKARNEADPVVYTTTGGIEIRKSAGEAAVALAKVSDEQAKKVDDLQKENAKLAEQREMAVFEKRAADELPHLPGTLQSRAALLKAAESIEDAEQRKQAVEALKAQNEGMSLAFKSFGTAGFDAMGVAKSGATDPASVDGKTPAEKLDALVKARMEKADDKTLTYEAVYADVVENTPEGAALYAAVAGG
ncbi:MAG: hypothetical protein OXE76_04125 [Alphaproteobacteria bacterium]|nr:hypothetical protein [Alphaproteobacteria bacterium]